MEIDISGLEADHFPTRLASICRTFEVETLGLGEGHGPLKIGQWGLQQTARLRGSEKNSRAQPVFTFQ